MKLRSNEFVKVLAYLTGKPSNNAKALTAMRTCKGFVDQTPYGVSQDGAWNYFNERFPKELSNFRIVDMDDLLYRAENYYDTYN